MRYEVVRSADSPDSWLAEAIDHDDEGVVYSTLFFGQKARERAEEYAAWKNNAVMHPLAERPFQDRPRRADN